MIRIAKLSFAHVHAKGYANAVRENPETELVAIWDEEEYGGRQIAEEYGIPFSTDFCLLYTSDAADE